MIVYWGKLAGLVLGAFGGVVGVLFGIFVGHLVDVIGAEFFLRRTMSRWLSPGLSRTPAGFDRSSALLALAVAYTAGPRWRPGPNDVAAFTDTLGPGPTGYKRLWLIVNGLHGHRYLESAIRLRTPVPAQALADRVTESLSTKQIASLIQSCWTILVAELNLGMVDRLRDFSHLCGLSADWAETFLPRDGLSQVQGVLDPDACVLLGVDPSADLKTVKRAYHKLAAQFHPDTTKGLSQDQQKQSEAAFVRIRDAYDRSVRKLRRYS